MSDASLNGLVAKVLGYDASSGRYKTELEKGLGSRKIKRSNIITEEECGESADGADGDDSLSGSGIGCHEKLNIGRVTASSLSASFGAAPACL